MKRQILFSIIMLLSIVVMAGLLPAAQALPATLTIDDSDTYEKTTNANEEVSYTWNVENTANVSYTVSVTAANLPDDWTSVPIIFTLPALATENVVIDILPPANAEKGETSTIISFVFANGSVIESATRTVKTTISGEYMLLGLYEVPEPLNTDIMFFLVTLLTWSAIGLFFAFLIDPVVKAFTKRTKTEADDLVVAALRKPVFVFVLIFGLIQSIETLPLALSHIDTITSVLNMAMILVIVWMAYRVFSELATFGKKYAETTETQFDDVVVPLLEKVVKLVIGIAVLFIFFQGVGVDLTVFVAGGVVVSMVIAFAAQDTLSNFISGIFLMLDRPFKVGDIILMDGDYCEVKDIGLRTTNLYNIFRHTMIYLPNNRLANDKIVNLIQPDTRFKVQVVVGVGYDSDINLVKEIMLDAATNHPNVLQEEGIAPFARLINFGDSSLDFKLYTWVDDIDNQWRVGAEMKETILLQFREKKIEIPFPQRVLYMHEMGRPKDDA